MRCGHFTWELRPKAHDHYNDVIKGTIASQITSLTIVYSTVYSDADQWKHKSSASLAFVRGIHRGPVNPPHKWPVTRKMFPFGSHHDDFMVALLERGPLKMCISKCVLLWLYYQFIIDVCYLWNHTLQASVVGNFLHKQNVNQMNAYTRFSWGRGKIYCNLHGDYKLWPLLLTWINFNPSMDK